MPDVPRRGSVRKASSAPDLPDLEKGFEHERTTARNDRLNTKGSTITRETITSLETSDEAADQLPPLQIPPNANNVVVPEKPRKQATFPPQTPASLKKSIFSGAPRVADPDPVADRLNNSTTPLTEAQFRVLIGIRQPDYPHQHPKDLIIRGGLYERIVHRLKVVQWQYRVFDVTTYILLGVQLALSSIFIVLGALDDRRTHLAIAILGAVSAVVAGVLALMKGQGLPNRLRRYRDGLKAVCFEAEELYWDVGAGIEVYFRDVRKVREDFLRIMDVAERNHPDNWNSFTDQLSHAQMGGGAQSQQGGKS